MGQEGRVQDCRRDCVGYPGRHKVLDTVGPGHDSSCN